jgi:hypothetical protein
MNLALQLLATALLAALVSLAGILWIEYTVPGMWPPWIGLPAETGYLPSPGNVRRPLLDGPRHTPPT